MTENRFDDEAMLRHGECMVATRLPVPTRHTRQTMSDIGKFDIERRGIEKVETPAGQHALPCTRSLGRCHRLILGASKRIDGRKAQAGPGRQSDGDSRVSSGHCTA
ncbi:conserved hypothetical protein [Ricinus communis]|uniref:Uncharacterized protein n=1 Tax=Ricinus communis TaxID=3988 RepID=B9TNM3_RICCO|nr:conserved hypothetical protein [Ricinus communis]